MTHRINTLSFGNRVLGWFGLLLIGIVGWVCDRAGTSGFRTVEFKSGEHLR